MGTTAVASITMRTTAVAIITMITSNGEIIMTMTISDAIITMATVVATIMLTSTVVTTITVATMENNMKCFMATMLLTRHIHGFSIQTTNQSSQHLKDPKIVTDLGGK